MVEKKIPETRTIPVQRDGSHVYAVADTAVVTTSLAGFFEVGFISARNPVTTQHFEVVNQDENEATLTSATSGTTPALFEVASIRMAPPVAVETAVTILAHAMSGGVSKANIAAQLRARGIID